MTDDLLARVTARLDPGIADAEIDRRAEPKLGSDAGTPHAWAGVAVGIEIALEILEEELQHG